MGTEFETYPDESLRYIYPKLSFIHSSRDCACHIDPEGSCSPLYAALWDPLRSAPPYKAQSQSPLFRLPLELRRQIYENAILDYDWQGSIHDLQVTRQCVRREFDLALLSTCLRIFDEAYLVPLTGVAHVFLSDAGFARSTGWCQPGEMETILSSIAVRHGTPVELEHVYFIINTSGPQTGWPLGILQMQHFLPRRITLSLKLNKQGNPSEFLEIESSVVALMSAYPTSLRELRLELDTLAFREPQLRLLAAEICQLWVFKRADGARLVAAPQPPEFVTYEEEHRTGACFTHRSQLPDRMMTSCSIKITFRPEVGPENTTTPVGAHRLVISKRDTGERGLEQLLCSRMPPSTRSNPDLTPVRTHRWNVDRPNRECEICYQPQIVCGFPTYAFRRYGDDR